MPYGKRITDKALSGGGQGESGHEDDEVEEIGAIAGISVCGAAATLRVKPKLEGQLDRLGLPCYT